MEMFGQGGLAARAVDALNFVAARDTGSAVSLIKRGYQESPTFIIYDSDSGNEPPNLDFQGKGWIIVLTAALMFIGLILVEYTLKVVLTLGIVEDQPAVYLPLGTDQTPKPAAVLGLNEPRAYITSSIRRTIRHLRAEAGPFAQWRGWNANIVYSFTLALLTQIMMAVFQSFMPTYIARPLAGVLGFLALTKFAMTCTHIIISRPQSTNWIRRLHATSWTDARRTLPSMAHVAVASTLAKELIHHSTQTRLPCSARYVLFFTGLFVGIFLAFPMTVALIRVQASTLSDTQEGIVSFDRTLGKTDDTAITFKDGLKSVGCAGWKRILKLTLKLAGILLALWTLFAIVIGAEIGMLMKVKEGELEKFLGQFNSY